MSGNDTVVARDDSNRRGAARVRQLFARAAKLGRCVIFIDELDALGKARSEGGPQFGARDEAEQTLNQLLTCMDGLVQNSGVVVLARSPACPPYLAILRLVL